MKRNLTFLPLLLAFFLLLSGCRTSQDVAAPHKSRTVIAVPEETQRQLSQLFMEAMRQKHKQAFDAEMELLNKMLSIYPDATEALYEKALLQLAFCRSYDTLKIEEAKEMLSKAVALEPANKFYKETLGKLYAGGQEIDKAVKVYEELVAEEPTTEVLTVLVKLYEEQGNWQGAIRALDRLENLEGKSVDYSIEKFKIYIEQNDTEKAYAAIEELCAEYPTDLRYRVLLGDLYHQNGHPELALATYNDVLAVEPENSFAQVSLLAYYKNAGNDSLYHSLIDEVVLNANTLSETRTEIMYNFVRDTFRSRGDTAHVDRLFQKALALPQTDASLLKLYLDFLTTIKAPEKATYAPLKQVLEIEPDNSRARGKLLEISLRQNNYEEAIRLCREGQLYDPNLLIFYYYEGLCLYTNDEKQKAIDALRRGATRIDEKTDPGIASDLYATLGDIYFDLKEKGAAFAAYDSALVHKSDNYMCMNNYAYYLSLEEVELDKAEALSRKTVEAFPEEPTYLDTYAWVLFQKQQYTQARLYIDETLKYTQEIAEDAGLFEHAGDIYYKCGDKESAINFWKKALSLSADEEQCAKLQKKIKLKRWVP